MPSNDDDKRAGAASWRQAMTTVGLALSLPWIIAAPTVLGWYIDKHYGSGPAGVIIGLLVGVFGAGLDVYKLLKQFGQFK